MTDSAETAYQADSLHRLVVEFLVCVVMTMLVIRTWLVEPRIVPTGSMAPTLLGEHVDLPCPHCGYRVQVDPNDRPVIGWATCPNCDASVAEDGSVPAADGDRLLLFKQAFRLRPPQRWEVAVFQRPGEADQAYVKRIVGLPGERVSLRHGDLYINGQIQRKSLPQQRALAVLVNDADYQADDLPSRWRGSAADTNWTRHQSVFRWRPPPGPRPTAEDPGLFETAHLVGQGIDQLDWLLYHQEVRQLGRPDETVTQPIDDRQSYNSVSHPRSQQELNAVADVLLRCRVRLADRAGTLWLQASDGREVQIARLSLSEDRAELYSGGRLVQRVALGAEIAAALAAGCTLEWSTVDRQLLLAIDEQLIFEPQTFQTTEPPQGVTSQPVGLAAENSPLQVDQLTLWRDVYYTPERSLYSRLGTHGPDYELGPDEYFMLGDNSACSEDSRRWNEGPAVPGRLLIGRPFLVHLPSRRVAWNGWWFHVPDWNRIRYIQ